MEKVLVKQDQTESRKRSYAWLRFLKVWCWPWWLIKYPSKWCMSWPCMNPRSICVSISTIALMVFPILMALYKGYKTQIDLWFQNRDEFLSFTLWSIYIIIGSSTFIKCFSFLRERHIEYSFSGSSEIAVMFKECAYSQSHLRETLKSTKDADLGKLEDRAKMVIRSLRKHMEKTITKISNSEKEVNITVYLAKGLLNKSYSHSQFNGILENLTSIDGQRFEVRSREINIFSDEHADYECAKCIRDNVSNVIQLNKSKYLKTKNKRSESVENYFGLMLADKDEKLLGFLNVEIHNCCCFEDEKTAREYLLEEMLAFKHALEFHIITEKVRKEAA